MSRRRVGCLPAGLAAILAILFVLISLPALALADVDQRLLHADGYKELLVREHVYTDLPDLIAQQLTYTDWAFPTAASQSSQEASKQQFISQVISSAPADLSSCLHETLGPDGYAELSTASRPPTRDEEDGLKACLRSHGVPTGAIQSGAELSVFFWLLTVDDWTIVLNDLVPPDWLQSTSDDVIDQVFGAIDSGDSNPTITVSLADLKTRLEGQPGVDAVVAIIAAQAPCGLDQLAAIQGILTSQGFGSGGIPLESMPLCSPPSQLVGALYPSIQATLAFAAGSIPDEETVTLGDQSGTDDPLAGPRQAFDAVHATVRVALFAVLILLVLLALLVAAVWRSGAAWLRWVGAPLLIAGGLGMLASFLALLLVPGAVSDAVSRAIPADADVAPILRTRAESLGSSLAREYFSLLLVQCLILIVAGVAMVGASIVWARLSSRSRPSLWPSGPGVGPGGHWQGGPGPGGQSPAGWDVTGRGQSWPPVQQLPTPPPPPPGSMPSSGPPVQHPPAPPRTGAAMRPYPPTYPPAWPPTHQPPGPRPVPPPVGHPYLPPAPPPATLPLPPRPHPQHTPETGHADPSNRERPSGPSTGG